LIAHLPPRARSIPRETEGAGRDLSASSASDVIDKECWYAGVRLCSPPLDPEPTLVSERRFVVLVREEETNQ
jgi:hypothetical protein